VVRHLSTLGLRSLVSNPPTLEEMFLRHYGDATAADATATEATAAGGTVPS
jgi:ABC-2 type transport system ATP-binding protein